MNSFVTRDEFKKLESTVDTIDGKVDKLTESVIRLEETLKNIPDKIIAEIPSRLYDNCTRIAIVEKTINKLESNQQWVTRTLIGTIITAIVSVVILKV